MVSFNFGFRSGRPDLPNNPKTRPKTADAAAHTRKAPRAPHPDPLCRRCDTRHRGDRPCPPVNPRG